MYKATQTKSKQGLTGGNTRSIWPPRDARGGGIAMSRLAADAHLLLLLHALDHILALQTRCRKGGRYNGAA